MSAHDIIYTHPGDARRPLTVECRCGLMFSATANRTAVEHHDQHFQDEKAKRIALTDGHLVAARQVLNEAKGE